MKQNILKFLVAMLCGLLFVGCATTKLTPEQQEARKADQAAIEEVIAQYAQAIRENNPEAVFAMCTDDVVLFSASKRSTFSLKEGRAGFAANDFKMLAAPGCNYTINDFKNWRFNNDEVLVDMQKASKCPGHDFYSQGGSKTSTMGFRKVDGQWKITYSARQK